MVGGDWYTFHSKHWGDVLAAGPGSGGQGLTPDDITGGQKYHDFTGEKDAWSAYVNERWEFLPGLTLIADLQYQHREYDFLHDEVGNFTGENRHAYAVQYDFFNPKGGLFYQTPWTPAGGDSASTATWASTQREPADNDYWGVERRRRRGARAPVRREREVVSEGGEVQYVRWRDPIIERARGELRGRTRLRPGAQRHAQRLLHGFQRRDRRHRRGLLRGRPARRLRYNADETVHKGLELGLRWRVAPDHRLQLAASRSWNEYEEFVFVEYAGAEPVDVSAAIRSPLFPEALVSATWTGRPTGRSRPTCACGTPASSTSTTRAARTHHRPVHAGRPRGVRRPGAPGVCAT